MVQRAAANTAAIQAEWFARSAPLHTALVRGQLFFPDRKLLQFDCGKLQVGGEPCIHLVYGAHPGCTVQLQGVQSGGSSSTLL